MSYLFVCEYCGRPIDADDELITLDVKSSDRLSERTGWVGHYHADCWSAMHDRIKLVHEFAPSLESMTTISGQAVAARRRKHRRS